MTTASSSESLFIDNTWLNQDSNQRLLTIEKLNPEDAKCAAFLLKVAAEDENEAVRCCAITHLTDLEVLKTLADEAGKIGETAQQQVYRVIAGSIESKHTERERLDQLQLLPAAGIKQVALITKLKTIGTMAIDTIKQSEDLADLCLFASSVHVRKSAAQKIDDVTLLEDILARVDGKDKTVSKVLATRLESATDNNQVADSATSKQEAEAKTEPKKEQDAEKEKVKEKAAQDASSVTSPENGVESTPVEEKPAAPVSQIENKEPANHTPAEELSVDPLAEFTSLSDEAEKLSFKNTSRLFEIRAQLRKLRTRLADPESELSRKIDLQLSEIEIKITKNNDYQEKLKEKTEILLVTLAEALEAGNSESATQNWDKIQGNINNTANQIRAELQKKAGVYKEKITELRDWKVFAATEKKKELIEQMQHLIESKMHASDRSKNISKMHKEWKELGRSNQNEQLWKQFKTLSDKAYEPCKEYFKQRKQLMVENLRKRREICDALEAEHKRLSEADSEIDVSALNKLISSAEKDWKSRAPIEQSKIKSMQKRFYGTINQLRKLRKGSLVHHAKRKQELVSAAQALTKLDDNKQAMNEAKRLQKEWKEVGPTSYKEDNKYWQEFRAACDIIFDKRNQVSNEQKAELQKIESRLKAILNELTAIAEKNDAELREARPAYKDLAQEFSNSLDPRLKAQKKRLLDQFNGAKRKIDSRFKALPDKKQQLIQDKLNKKATLLQSLESQLIEMSASDKYLACIEGFDKESYLAVADSGNPEIDDLMQQRLNAVLATTKQADLLTQCQLAEARYRELCVQAEIRANVDTPAEDKPLRMKLQLEQLQSGFGQAKPDPKQNLKYALTVEFQSYAQGPLQESVRDALGQRLAKVLQKLR